MIDANLITSDPEILGGTPVFTGTRIPVAVLLENLADGLPLEEILDSYPTLPREAARTVMQNADVLCENLKAEIQRVQVYVQPADVDRWAEMHDTATGERCWIPVELLNLLHATEMRRRGIPEKS